MPVWIVQTGIYYFILLRDNISFVFSSNIQWVPFRIHL